MIWKEWEEERIFISIMTFIALLVLFLTPAICTPDENAHFANAYSISYGNIFPEVKEEKLGRYISKDVIQFVNQNNKKYSGDLTQKYSFLESYFDSWLPETGEKELAFWNAGSLALINPAGYLICAAGMAIGRGLTSFVGKEYLTPYNLLLFGRLANAVFYIIAGYFAIKIIPCFKRGLLVILLMPMSIFLGVSISYDAILIPISALFFANTTKILLSEEEYRISHTDIIITFISTFFLTGIKTAYAPFLALLLFIPKKKFGTKKKYISCIIATIGIAIFIYGGYKIMTNIKLGGFQLPEHENVIAQKEFFFSHMTSIPKIIKETWTSYKLFYLQGFFGKLGQLDTNFPLPFMLAFYICFGLVIISDICSMKYTMKRSIRIVTIVLNIIFISGIFLFMYLTWTPLVEEVGGYAVSGVQGRYFIPAFAFLCLPFFNGILLKNDKVKEIFQKMKYVLSEVLIINSAVLTCLILFLRYWD